MINNKQKYFLLPMSLCSALVTVGVHADSVQTEIGETTLTFSGYVKLDAIHNFDEDAGDLLFPQSVPVDGASTGSDAQGSADGQTHFHARETRLALTSEHPMAFGGSAKAHVEVDFFGSPGGEIFQNSNEPRVRHAFFDWNGILAGQTWSNFMPLVALPQTLDFHGPAGYVFVRQSQVRYTMDVTAGVNLAFALENPESSIAGQVGEPDSFGDIDGVDRMPDLSVQLSGTRAGLGYAVSGVVTRPEVDDGEFDDSTMGYGLMAAVSHTATGGTRVGANLGYVEGANRYILGTGGSVGAPNNFSNAYLTEDGELETFSEVAAMAFVERPLSEQWVTNVVLGHVNTDTDSQTEAAGVDQTESFSVHGNLQYQPSERLMYGAELQWAERTLENANDNNLTRLQLSARYSF